MLVAVGYQQPHIREPKVWLMRPFTENSQAAWEEFFDLLPGTPRRIVADMDRGILAAVASSFPPRNEPAPTYTGATCTSVAACTTRSRRCTTSPTTT